MLLYVCHGITNFNVIHEQLLKVDKSKQDIALDAKKKPNITWIKHPWKSSVSKLFKLFTILVSVDWMLTYFLLVLLYYAFYLTLLRPVVQSLVNSTLG